MWPIAWCRAKQAGLCLLLESAWRLLCISFLVITSFLFRVCIYYLRRDQVHRNPLVVSGTGLSCHASSEASGTEGPSCRTVSVAS